MERIYLNFFISITQMTPPIKYHLKYYLWKNEQILEKSQRLAYRLTMFQLTVFKAPLQFQ